MNFTLIVERTLVGEFAPKRDFDYRFSYLFYCLQCGEVFATRVQPPPTVWTACSGYCLSCSEQAPPSGNMFSFLTPGEELEGFEPLPILAYNFLYNYYRCMNDG